MAFRVDCYRRLVSGLVDLEAHLARAPADAVRRAEEPGRFAVTAGVGGQAREDLEKVRNA